MSVLCDFEIRQLCEQGMVQPFDPALINPASLDIRIGNKLLIASPVYYPDFDPHGWMEEDISDLSKDQPFMLAPRQFVLVESLETFHVPNSVCAQFFLKSSRGREGYDHCEAGYIDPGYHGSKLTMELYNVNTKPLPLYPGLRIGQLQFTWMSNIPQKSYAVTGRYNNDQTVMASKG